MEPKSIRLAAIGASLVIGTLLMAAKFYVYRMTRSSAVLSDALESIINVAAALFAVGSILLAAKPADESHPYGHGKIEYFSAGFEGALIILAALGIFKSAWDHLHAPRGITNLDAGLLILAGTAVINLALGIALVHAGRHTRSLTLEADGRHVLSDVYTSAGVLAGLLLVRITGWLWLDGAVAALVGLHILVIGSGLIRRSFQGLMDASDPDLLQEVSTLLDRHRRPVWIDIHQLRAFRSGEQIHIDFHLILPRDFSLEEAHREADAAEELIVHHFGTRAKVLIHMDPCLDPDCPVCVRRICDLRAGAFEGRQKWERRKLTAHSSDEGPPDESP